MTEAPASGIEKKKKHEDSTSFIEKKKKPKVPSSNTDKKKKIEVSASYDKKEKSEVHTSVSEKKKKPEVPISVREKKKRPEVPTSAHENKKKPKLSDSYCEKKENPELLLSVNEKKKKPKLSASYCEKKENPELLLSVNEKKKKPEASAYYKKKKPEVPTTVSKMKKKPEVPASVKEKEKKPKVPTFVNEKKKKPEVPVSVPGKKKNYEHPYFINEKEKTPKVPTFVNEKKKKPEVPTFVVEKKKKPEVPTFVVEKKKKPEVPTFVVEKKKKPEVPTFVVKKKKKPEVPTFVVKKKKKPEVPTLVSEKKKKKKKKKMSEVATSVDEEAENGNQVSGISVFIPKKHVKVKNDSSKKSAKKNKMKKETEPRIPLSQDISCSNMGSDDEKQHMRQNPDRRFNLALQDFHKQQKVGDVMGVTATMRKTLVAVLTPDTTIYFQGLVRICPLVGTVKILGYTLREGEVQTVYSLPSGGLLGITAVSAPRIDPTDSRLQDREIPMSWLQDIFRKEPGPLLVLEVQKHIPPVASSLSRIGWGGLFEGGEKQEHWCNIGATLITQSNYRNYYLTEEKSVWGYIGEAIKSFWTCGNVPRVVLCGGKGVGKSTFFKYITNVLLSSRSDSGIMCLDLDPGQPEFSLPACVSLAHLMKPLLGPAYTHNISENSSKFRQILVGSVDAQSILQSYMAAIQCMHQLSERQPSVPLLVNTMGWTHGTGLNIMLDVLRITKPTHVIQIQHTHHRNNFAMELHSQNVVKAKRGIITKAHKFELCYHLFIVPSAVRGRGAPSYFSPKVLRELRITSHVSQFVDQQLLQNTKATQNNTSNLVKLSWTNVVLHICNHLVPREHMLHVIKGQLVALCQVSPDNIETVGPDLPKQLARDSDLGELIGWGVVRGIDSSNQELAVLAGLQPQEVKHLVNAVIMPELHLPEYFSKLLSLEGPLATHCLSGKENRTAQFKENQQVNQQRQSKKHQIKSRRLKHSK